jgi:hypothetical protein
MPRKVKKQELSVQGVRDADTGLVEGIAFFAVAKYYRRNPMLGHWPDSDDEFEFQLGEPQPTAMRAKADSKRWARTFAKYFPGSKVVATDTAAPFSTKVVDKRKRTFAEFGVVSEDYRDETIH